MANTEKTSCYGKSWKWGSIEKIGIIRKQFNGDTNKLKTQRVKKFDMK